MSPEASHIPVKSGSPRGFGFVMCGFFVLLGLYPLTAGGALRWWALVVAAVFLLLAVVRPSLLAGPNRLWFRLGLVLGAVVAPVVMGVVYFLVILPMGLMRRLFKRDPLGMQPDAGAASYWVEREQSPQPMRNQF
ncbi:SxtJ family membrane protein [Granulosicoccaceae sp. 1_MG-2023]|nr:SxtJ family membrane protein [Granulosicoccaceae sp. 1_MG-2023]